MTPSIWSIAIGIEVGSRDAVRVRFWCLDCLPRMDPAGAWAVRDAPWARECMACVGPREPVVMAVSAT